MYATIRSMHYEEALDLFLERMHCLGMSAHTLRAYRGDIVDLFSSLIKFQITQVGELTREHIDRFMRAHHHPRTLRRKVSAFRTFYHFLIHERLASSNPWLQVMLPKMGQPLPRSIDTQQMLRILQQPNTKTLEGIRDRSMLELLYSSGLRVGELVQLRIQDLSVERHEIYVHGKGNQDRIIPVTPYAIRWIEKYLACRYSANTSTFQMNQKLKQGMDQEIGRRHGQVWTGQTQGSETQEGEITHIFLNRSGRPLTTRSVERMCKKYVMQAGLPPSITPHTIRHAIATHWLEMGMDIKTIQRLLGHASLSTTSIYTHVSLTLKEKALRSLNEPRNELCNPSAKP